MAVSEEKMRIVINNYFKSECNVDTSIREAFEKGFRIGVQKGQSTSFGKGAERKTGKWVKISPAGIYECNQCGQNVMTADIEAYKFCHGCGAKMEG